jgi:hypothetical protein
VLSTKVVPSDFGNTLKMLVRVQTPNGQFRVFGTVPSGMRAVRPGDQVIFNATLQPKEPGFGFFSRPTVSL